MKPWQHAEARAARVLGGRRVKRERLESAPDVVDVPGWLPEVKYRRRLPRLVVDAIRQAEGYAILGQRPVAVLFEKGSRAGLAVLRLDDFARLVLGSGRPLEAVVGGSDRPPSPDSPIGSQPKVDRG